MALNRFIAKYRLKSDAELEQIVSDSERFMEQARVAAIEVLKERQGSTESIQLAEQDIKVNQEKKKRQEEKKAEVKRQKYITEDPNAPALHSKRVITVFATVFTTIFGAVLLMQNLRETGNQKARNEVLIFGILYTIGCIIVINLIDIQANIALVFNLGGAILLTEVFWNKHLGKDTLYRKRSWIKPAVISVAITVLFILIMIF